MAPAERQETHTPARPPQGGLSLAEFWSRIDPEAERDTSRGQRRPAGRAR